MLHGLRIEKTHAMTIITNINCMYIYMYNVFVFYYIFKRKFDATYLYRVKYFVFHYAIYRDFTTAKIENFLMKNLDIFKVFVQNIDCRGGSNEYPQSMFWSKNKYTPANPRFSV